MSRLVKGTAQVDTRVFILLLLLLTVDSRVVPAAAGDILFNSVHDIPSPTFHVYYHVYTRVALK